MLKFIRDWHRKKIKAQPFPQEWTDIVKARVEIFNRLDGATQRQLQDHIKVFIAEKRFLGAAELEITDEIRVVIAAYACMLLLNRNTDYFPHLDQIVVYPSGYFAEVEHHVGGGIYLKTTEGRLGESWDSGQIVLSWNSVEQGIINPSDGRNVVFHEFAHQLDQQSGHANGAPVLESRAQYMSWGRVLGREYERLLEQIELRQKPFFDEYGATDPAEFFAVLTEFFFERPRQFQERHPELYEELRKFYKQDPVQYC